MPKLFNTNTLVFGIPQPSRLIYLAISVLSLLFFGGIVFGWSELQVSFEREGYFANQCSNSSLDADINNVDSANKPTQSPRAAYLQRALPCSHLNSQFGEIFFIGCIAATIVPVIIGPIQDRVSNMWARVFAGCMVSGGLVSISLAGKESITLVKLGAALLGAGGNGYQLTSFPMAVLFPGNEGLISSVCTGFFSISSLVFLGIRLLQDNYGFSLSSSLMLYTYLSSAFVFLSFAWPHDFSQSQERKDAPTVIQDEIGSSMRISARHSIRESQAKSRHGSLITEGRSSWASGMAPFDAVNIAGAPDDVRRNAKLSRPTWHPSHSSTTSNAILSPPTSSRGMLSQTSPAHSVNVDSTGIGAQLSTGQHLEPSAEDVVVLPLSQNEEISQKLKLSLLSGVQQLRSREYIALVINFLIGSLVSDFYIGSYLQQTRRLPAKCSAGSTLVECDAQKLAVFQTAWSAIYPCGAIASPLFGIAIDKLQFRHVFVVVVLVSICHQGYKPHSH
jgi:hypothetical protein